MNELPPQAADVPPAPADVSRADGGGAMSGAQGVADDVPRALDRRYVRVQRILGWITAAVVALFLMILAVSAMVHYGPGPVLVRLMWGGVVTATVGLGVAAHIWPVVEYRHASWRLNAEVLEIRRGVWWREVLTLPRSRVQHTDVNQGPIERHFGLGHLVIHTAGTATAQVRLEGLSYETALAIRDHLVRAGRGDAV